MKKLFVTGASGFLGWELCRRATTAWDVCGLYNEHPVEVDNAVAMKLDLTNYGGLKSCFIEKKPDAVIHTAAVSNPNYCQQNPEISYGANVTASRHLAGLCADRRIPFVFTSSDLVFDGLNAPYREENPVNPVNRYGEQKALAEQEVLKIYPDSAVCRMPLMFGLGSPAYGGFFRSMMNSIKTGSELKLFTDEFRTPVSTATAAEGLLMALIKARGLLHLGGRQRISRYDLGMMLADIMGAKDVTLTALLQEDIPQPAPRAADVSLDSSKAYKLGYNPPSLREELLRLLK